jgi:hypothetical protein
MRPAPAPAVRAEHLTRKITAIGQYTSQLRMLWPAGQDWRALFLDHARSADAGGTPPEHLWDARDATPAALRRPTPETEHER